ncbi:hypothetical protein J1605_021206 [Eschrichtius robustus]|uniref:Uncharacterized protein n=1 Tax=Eschrichtius robustus TaxID=9764 RepID=A0AB34HFA6_ESCRO|nr:hypothetical protein J1605_021206 [Eschrichtius robustus]
MCACARAPRGGSGGDKARSPWARACGAGPGCGARRGGGRWGGRNPGGGGGSRPAQPHRAARGQSPHLLPFPPRPPGCRPHAGRGARLAPPLGEPLPRARGVAVADTKDFVAINPSAVSMEDEGKGA